jgi:phosphatidylserine/phosphatidylglycerophosphate/cardiolipin synthase-like enzyme
MTPDRQPRRFARRVSLAAILVVVLMLAGCAGFGRGERSVAQCLEGLGPSPDPVTGIFIEPDDGYPPVLDELARAKCTLDVMVYMLTDDEVFAALANAESRGVRVRVILEEHPFGMFGDQSEALARLDEAGADAKWGLESLQFTHAKYIVIDQRVALVMNQNLTRSAFNGNREFGVITTSPDVVSQAQGIFDADWARTGDGVPAGPLIVSPEGSREAILAYVTGAERSIAFYAEVIRDEGILAALGDAEARGVEVRLIVNASLDDDDLAALAELQATGVEIRLMETIYIHAKTMIVDGERALIGSHNYTMTSLDRNREVGLVVDDPALVTRVIAVYERDWARAIPAEVVPAAIAMPHADGARAFTPV